MLTARIQPFTAAVALLCLLSAPLSQAQNGHAQLSTAVREYVESLFAPSELRTGVDGEDLSRRVEIELSNLDPRLPVPVCELPLQAQINQNQRPVGRINVKVDCFRARADQRPPAGPGRSPEQQRRDDDGDRRLHGAHDLHAFR